MSEETKKKISLSKLGKPSWNKGVPMSVEARKKLSLTNKGKSHNDALVVWVRENGSWNKGLYGDKSHCWKGGLTSKNALERRSFVLTIQKEVLARDNHTCQQCGSKKDLQVDHIQPWSEYVEGRFSMDNCRTLCRSCHFFITYGRKMPKDSQWGLNLMTRRTT